MSRGLFLGIAASFLFGSPLPGHGADFKPYQSGILRGGDAPTKVSVDLHGLRDLYLVVTDGGDNYSSDQAIWAEPTLIRKDGTPVDMTTLAVKGHHVGWGRLCVNKDQNGDVLGIGNRKFDKGFWAHGPSYLHFKLPKEATAFQAYVGIDEGTQSGSVTFEVTNVQPKLAASRKASREPVVLAPPSEDITPAFNPAAARVLMDRGMEKLLFVKRYTLSANHVYTEYVNSQWTPGGGLCVLDLKTGEVKELVPECNEGVVNRFDLSFDAGKVIFDYKRSADEGYRLYEAEIDAGSARQLTFPQANEQELVKLYGSRGYHHGTDDLHPCYLPDGDIAFVSTRCKYSILCNAGDVYTTKTLHRMSREGKGIRPLSNNAVSEASPVILPDGRILYHRWEYVDKAAGNVKCLWSMMPDGTGSAEVYGNNLTFPETLIYGRPIPGSDKIVALGSTHCCPNNAMGTVIVFDRGKNLRGREVMNFVTKDVDAVGHTGFTFLVDGQWKQDKTGSLGRLFKDPYPISEDLFIVSHKPKGYAWNAPIAYDLSILDGAGNRTLLYRDGGISCWHPYPVRPRKKPPVPRSTIDEEMAAKGLATCIVTDIYEGMDGVERGTIKHLRVMEQVPRPWTARNTWAGDRSGMAHTVLGTGLLGLKVQHGVVPVESDGSAYFHVPADRNLYFQALDENYMAVQTERTFVNYRPGETRSCIGCHETQHTASTPTFPQKILALQRPPSKPGPQPGETAGRKLLDYAKHVQPVWDRHCLECHHAEKAGGGLDLSGTLTSLFNVSYEQLKGVKRGSGPKVVAVGVQPNEDVGSAGVEFLPPYSEGAHTSPLIEMISHGKVAPQKPRGAIKPIKEHEAIELSREEFIRVANWLDSGCQYHPSYWGRKNLQHKDHPHFRPNVTFEDAVNRDVPPSLALSVEP